MLESAKEERSENEGETSMQTVINNMNCFEYLFFSKSMSVYLDSFLVLAHHSHVLFDQLLASLC